MKSPTIGYKIAIRSGADLNNEEHYVFASKRQNRAIRKARLMRTSNRDVMLFGVRKDGTTFPVSLKQPKWEVPKGNGLNSQYIVMPADFESQANTMREARRAQAAYIRSQREFAAEA